MVNLVLHKSAVCIDLACFSQLPCAKKICSKCLSKEVLKTFSVPANTISYGKVFIVHNSASKNEICILISKNCFRA